jgi:hypothetical protein
METSMPRSFLSRPPLVIAALAAMVALVALAAIAANFGPSSNGNVAPNPVDCQHWCGSGSATVTVSGTKNTISGGSCYDQGSAGVDARFGDWEDDSDQINYLALTVYRAGGPTPPPTPTAIPQPTGPAATPEPTDPPQYNVSGSVDGNPFILDVGAAVSLDANGHGTFSGVDIDGAGTVSGTFSCK